MTQKRASFRWTRKREQAALLLAQGYNRRETAEAAGLSRSTIQRWVADLEFSTEIDRLSLMVGIASKAERLRIAMRVAREKIRDDKVETTKDLLDWLKFAQSETDGTQLNLSAIFTALECPTEVGTGEEDGEGTVV